MIDNTKSIEFDQSLDRIKIDQTNDQSFDLATIDHTNS
jgi:hypothetical protein